MQFHKGRLRIERYALGTQWDGKNTTAVNRLLGKYYVRYGSPHNEYGDPNQDYSYFFYTETQNWYPKGTFIFKRESGGFFFISSEDLRTCLVKSGDFYYLRDCPHEDILWVQLSYGVFLEFVQWLKRNACLPLVKQMVKNLNWLIKAM